MSVFAVLGDAENAELIERKANCGFEYEWEAKQKNIVIGLAKSLPSILDGDDCEKIANEFNKFLHTTDLSTGQESACWLGSALFAIKFPMIINVVPDMDEIHPLSIAGQQFAGLLCGYTSWTMQKEAKFLLEYF